MKKEKIQQDFLFLPTRGIFLLEGEIITLEIGRKTSFQSILTAYEKKSNLVLIPQTNKEKDDINSAKDLEQYGVIVKITDIPENNGNSLNVKLACLTLEEAKLNGYSNTKVKLVSLKEDKKNNLALFEIMDEVVYIKPDLKDFTLVQDLYEKLKILSSKKVQPFLQHKDSFSIETLSNIEGINKVYSLLFDSTNKYQFLATSNGLVSRIKKLLEIITYKSEDLIMDGEIDKQLHKNLSQQQSDFILREKMKVIQNKLGEEHDIDNKINVLLDSDDMKDVIPEDVKILIKKEKSKLKSMMSVSPEANIVRTYLDVLSSLPWRKTTIEKFNLDEAKKILNAQHYGLKKVKERIIEFLAVVEMNKRRNPDKYSKRKMPGFPDIEINQNLFVSSTENKDIVPQNIAPIITLLGPPGVGKTSIAKSMADAMGRKFIKISLGGVKDESEIRGHRRSYLGAMPGKIINAIKKAGVSNPMILLDEIDKMASDHKGDPASAMLEVLDPEQNTHFQDHYLEVEYDLSKVMFVATANYWEGIPQALMDRVELIELSSYTLLEKVKIGMEHLVPKVIKQNSLKPEEFIIDAKTIEFIVKHYTMEAGVRGLQRALDKLARKTVLRILENKNNETYIIDKKVVKRDLGTIIFLSDDKDDEEQIGAVNGLAYTSYGGSTLLIEVNIFPGKGELKLTGQLKDVMQESAQIALAYIRSNAKKFGVENFDWEEKTIHIHVPEGAVPKDGPSAGVTFTTSLLSALTGKPISHKVGMTGEITLRGKVLAIGGLKEKSLAALKNGINKIFIPKENERNLEDIPKEVKKEIEFIPVKHYEEIYENLFVDRKTKNSR